MIDANEIDIETAATRWHAHGHTIRMKYDHGIWMNEKKREKCEYTLECSFAFLINCKFAFRYAYRWRIVYCVRVRVEVNFENKPKTEDAHRINRINGFSS